MIRDQQQAYYEALRSSDQEARATVSIEFMLNAILMSLKELELTTDQVTDQVANLLFILKNTPAGTLDLMNCLDLSHRPSFRQNYLRPALGARLITMTRPDTPNAHNQKYQLTQRGKQLKTRLK